jgi:DNA ligase D-like protein (predicted 3'-phosphoesterase)
MAETLRRFVVQQQDAITLHFDFRLEVDGVLRSCAVPKGPSLDPGQRRLAAPVEDHWLRAGEFEGVHAQARRGSGVGDQKLQGRWALPERNGQTSDRSGGESATQGHHLRHWNIPRRDQHASKL